MTYRDWTPEHRQVIAYAFEAWVENQYDDMAADGGQDETQLDRWSNLIADIRSERGPVFTENDLQAVENAAWNLLDTPDAFDPTECDPELVRDACRIAGWNWEGEVR